VATEVARTLRPLRTTHLFGKAEEESSRRPPPSIPRARLEGSPRGGRPS